MYLTCLFLVLSADISLSLKEEVTLHRGKVFLKDVLTTDSYNSLASLGLDNIQVAKGPGFNRGRAVHRSQVATAMKAKRSDLKVNFKGPNATLVHRASGTFSASAVEAAIREWVTIQPQNNGELEVNQIRVPSVSRIPPGPVVYQIRTRGRGQLVGRKSLFVDLVINGSNFKTLAVSVAFSIRALVAVVSQDLKRGRAIDDSTVSWEYQRIERLNAPLIRPEAYQGLRTRTMLRAGDLLTERNTEPIPLVLRNQMVEVIVRNGALRVTLKAMALGNGGRGDLVRLKNTDSGQLLQGYVNSMGTVDLR